MKNKQLLTLLTILIAVPCVLTGCKKEPDIIVSVPIEPVIETKIPETEPTVTENTEIDNIDNVDGEFDGNIHPMTLIINAYNHLRSLPMVHTYAVYESSRGTDIQDMVWNNQTGEMMVIEDYNPSETLGGNDTQAFPHTSTQYVIYENENYVTYEIIENKEQPDELQYKKYYHRYLNADDFYELFEEDLNLVLNKDGFVDVDNEPCYKLEVIDKPENIYELYIRASDNALVKMFISVNNEAEVYEMTVSPYDGEIVCPESLKENTSHIILEENEPEEMTECYPVLGHSIFQNNETFAIAGSKYSFSNTISDIVHHNENLMYEYQIAYQNDTDVLMEKDMVRPGEYVNIVAYEGYGPAQYALMVYNDTDKEVPINECVIKGYSLYEIMEEEPTAQRGLMPIDAISHLGTDYEILTNAGKYSVLKWVKGDYTYVAQFFFGDVVFTVLENEIADIYIENSVEIYQ